MKHLSFTLVVAACLLVMGPAVAETVLVQDPLNGSTIGSRSGNGEFVSGGGWRSTGGKVVFDAGRTITDGYFEARMRGWTAPAQGTDKSHPLSGWENANQYGHYTQAGSFWNWRIGTGYNPFKVLAAPQNITTRVEARVGNNSAVNDGGTHIYRVEWRDGTVRFYFNGQELRRWTLDRFAMRYFVIGKDDQYGITNPAPIISDVRIVERRVNTQPSITTPFLVPGSVGRSYSATIEVSSGDPPLTFDIASGELPPGLSLTGDTIAGTPQTAGTFAFRVRVRDADGDIDERDYGIHIDTPAPADVWVFTPVADTYVDAGAPGSNFGSADELMVAGGASPRVSYLRFDLGGLPENAIIESADLILFATRPGNGGAVRLFAADHSAWLESQPTYSSPLAGADASGDLCSLGTVSAGLGSNCSGVHTSMPADGHVTFVVRSDDDSLAAFASRDHASSLMRPALRVKYRLGTGGGEGPEVRLTAPIAGQLVWGTVQLVAAASSGAGIASVVFVVDGQVQGTVYVEPFEWAWDSTGWPLGERPIVARATDGAGTLAVSDPVVVRLIDAEGDVSPSAVEIVSPLHGARISESTLWIVVEAQDDEQVTLMSFEIDGDIVRSLASPPWTIGVDMRGRAPGEMVLVAIAEDLSGHSSRSEPVTVVLLDDLTLSTGCGCGAAAASPFSLFSLTLLALFLLLERQSIWRSRRQAGDGGMAGVSLQSCFKGYARATFIRSAPDTLRETWPGPLEMASNASCYRDSAERKSRLIRSTEALFLMIVVGVVGVWPATLEAQRTFVNQTGTQYAPYLEWELRPETIPADPYFVEGRAVFTHTESGEVRSTGFFFDESGGFRFRFSGALLGEWTLVTESSHAELDGYTGSVTITRNPNPLIHGHVTSYGGRHWARPIGPHGTKRVFVPQFVMARRLIAYHNNPALIDSDVNEFIHQHGFSGVHVEVFCGWFHVERERHDQFSTRDPLPDPRTFETLERVIAAVHAAGGVVHLWKWGDEDRRMTPIGFDGGINGTTDRRLQRYIAARLGPLPGWTVGYGFDLHEWVNGSQLEIWHANMQAQSGWPLMLGGRWEKNRLTQATEVLDYSSYEDHRPSYDRYVETIEARPGKPSFSEDRFRVREGSAWPEKDYTLEQMRRGLYHSTMAGGVANIWGYLIPGTRDGGSYGYPNAHEIRTYREFFRERFHNDVLIRANELTTGVALRSADHTKMIVYQDNTNAVTFDLSAMPSPGPVIAVDTRAGSYVEHPLGDYEPGQHTWTAGHVSDWIIAVGDFSYDDGPQVNISNPFMEPGLVGTHYDVALFADFGTAPLQWSISAGELPPGLALHGDRILGVPALLGLFPFRPRVEDAAGDFDERDYEIMVGPPLPEGVTILLPEADTYVDPANVLANFGASDELLIGGGPEGLVAFLRFDLNSTVVGSMAAATLRLGATRDGEGGFVRVFAPSDPYWPESQPTHSDPLAGLDASGDLCNLGMVAAGRWVDCQLSLAALPEVGTVTLTIQAEGDGTAYASKEHAGHLMRPRLLLFPEASEPGDEGLKVRLVEPQPGERVTGTVRLLAEATSTAGVIEVDFFVDGQPVASAQSSPYEAFWDTSNLELGERAIVARARDWMHREASSSPVTVVLVDPADDVTLPSVRIVSPEPGAIVDGSTLWVTVEATDNVEVATVALEVDGEVVQVLGAEPWVVAVDVRECEPGEIALVAIAEDRAGNRARSEPVHVFVSDGGLNLGGCGCASGRNGSFEIGLFLMALGLVGRLDRLTSLVFARRIPAGPPIQSR